MGLRSMFVHMVRKAYAKNKRVRNNLLSYEVEGREGFGRGNVHRRNALARISHRHKQILVNTKRLREVKHPLLKTQEDKARYVLSHEAAHQAYYLKYGRSYNDRGKSPHARTVAGKRFRKEQKQ